MPRRGEGEEPEKNRARRKLEGSDKTNWEMNYGNLIVNGRKAKRRR